MRLLLALTILTGCSVEERRSQVDSATARQTVVEASSGIDHAIHLQAQSSSPAEGIGPKTVGTDSSFAGLTPLSDSITHIGSAPMDSIYASFDYRQNGVEYASIVREIGTKPNGQPLMGIVTTVELPRMDSTEHLFPPGFCGPDYTADNYVIAVVGIGGDSVWRNIKKAWRFDREAKTLREIPTKNVVCFDPMADD
jgi:hypothetical protein